MPVSQQQLQQFIQALMGGQQQQPQSMWASGMTQMPSGGGGGLGQPVAGYNPQAQMQWAIQQEQQRNTPQMQQLMAEQQRRSAQARTSMGQSPYNQQFIMGVDDWAQNQPGYMQPAQRGSFQQPPQQMLRQAATQPMFGGGQQQNPFMNSGFRTGGPEMPDITAQFGNAKNSYTDRYLQGAQQQNPYMSAMGFGGQQQNPTFNFSGNPYAGSGMQSPVNPMWQMTQVSQSTPEQDAAIAARYGLTGALSGGSRSQSPFTAFGIGGQGRSQTQPIYGAGQPFSGSLFR